MNVLVTGGAGFIGSHVAEGMLGAGHRVAIVDNESTGKRENVPDGAAYFRADVSRAEELEPVFEEELDAVCHIAGQVSIIRSFNDPIADLRTNTEGTVNVLRLCVKYKVPRLIYASSMTNYGHTTILPIPEDYPCAPTSYYGITKYAAERYVQATGSRADLGFSFHVTSLRMYNVYGSRQALDNPYQGVLGIFLGNLLRREPITIFGDGEQSRDFVHISDVVRAWVSALDNESSFGRVFNIGSGRRLSINQLADRLLAAFHENRSTWEMRYLPARPGEQRHVEADIRLAASAIDWKPEVSFEEGLQETLRWAVEGAGAVIGAG
ncbi:MAG: NAD-dependent epimerase/dehydratase family protein [Chloracidobacterium sp.]|nr:NAD-dependent epimerase/dehydratase family protein [Chloracidobacterium sp.]